MGRPHACLSIFVCLSVPVLAQSPLVVRGVAGGEAAGSAVAFVGDLDGDFADDFVVGAPLEATNGVDAGAVRWHSGATGSVLRTTLGAAAGDLHGAAVAAAGDVDGDGTPDVIVGAPGDSTAGAAAGSFTVYSGATGAVLQHVDGDAAGDGMGSAVAGVGDANGDGYDDCAAGAPGSDLAATDGGAVRVYSGADGTVLRTLLGSADGDAFGASVSGAGDLDGDCFDDVWVGAPGADNGAVDAGRAIALSVATGAVLQSFDGLAGGDALGTAVAGAGDLDGDGVSDGVVGAPGDDTKALDAGSVVAISGATGTVLWTREGRAAGDALGTAVSAGGKHDADAEPDVVVGVPGDDVAGVDAGAVLTLRGTDGAALRVDLGAAAGDAAGTAVASGGDSDLDGYADVLFGAPGDDVAAADAGAASVYRERPADGVAAGLPFTSSVAGARFGLGLASLSDLDGDGVKDYAIGAPFEDPGKQGTVRVYSGATQTVIHTIRGPAQADTWFGNRIADIGDITGDGVGDLLIGSWHWDESGVQDSGRAELFSGADAQSLGVFTSNQFRAHMGSSVGGLGDINGDSVPDFFIGLGIVNGEAGALRVYSGATLTELRTLGGTVPFQWFGWSAVATGDLNGDGISELAIGSPSGAVPSNSGKVEVYDTTTWTPIYTWSLPTLSDDLFGESLAVAGDVNGDGTNDIIVGAYQADPLGLVDAGMVRVFSGATGGLLYELAGSQASELFGNRVAGAGDVNGDGFDDFMVGSPQYFASGVFLAGRVTLFSGYDGRVLQTFDGSAAQEQRRGCVGLGDLNGDGLSDVLVSSDFEPFATQEGLAHVYLTQRGADTGMVHLLGPACASVAGSLPRIGTTGTPAIGQVFDTTLRTAPPVAPAFWMVGGTHANLPLAVLGAPGCVATTLPLATLAALTDANGKASLPSPVPNNPSLVGGALFVQWGIANAANPLGFIASNGARITIGAQ